MSELESKPNESARPRLVDRLRALFGGVSLSVRDDIEEALAESSKEEISAQEQSMLRSVLSLHDLRVREIMVPRADIISVELDDSLFEILETFRTAGHSRLPVHGQTLDDPRGMVHIRDFVDYLARQAEHDDQREGVDSTVDEGSLESNKQFSNFGNVNLSITLEKAGIARPVLFVPPSMLVLDVLIKMQAERTHMALVIDEYGGTDGLVSIEDVVEVIVGDIEDEHDEEDTPSIVAEIGGSLVVDARASVSDIAVQLKLDVAELDGGEDIDTIGGVVATIAGRVPSRGEVIQTGSGLEFEILDADPRRVKKLRIKRIEKDSSSEE